MRLTLPFPPSTNRIWRKAGKRIILTATAKAYRTEVGWLVNAARQQGFGRREVSVDVVAFMPDRQRRDLDNLLKSSMDALQAARVFEDDSQIVDLRIRHGGVDRDRPRLEIEVAAA